METLLHILHDLNAATVAHWLREHATVDNYLHLIGILRSLEWLRQKFTPRPPTTLGSSTQQKIDTTADCQENR